MHALQRKHLSALQLGEQWQLALPPEVTLWRFCVMMPLDENQSSDIPDSCLSRWC